jgi:putative phage-type endonuclease
MSSGNNKIDTLLKIPQYEQRSLEWFAQREDKLTASDAATALGINPYQKPHELLFKKCGFDPKPFVGNIATRHGQYYEDIAIEKYCRVMGMTNYNFGLISYTQVERENPNSDYYFLAGSPDGICIKSDHPENEPILLEVKCPFRRKIIMNQCPKYYYPQVQLNMLITGLKLADFIEYKPADNNTEEILNIVRIHINYDWLSNNIPILYNFWKEVENYRNIGIQHHPKFKKNNKRIIDLFNSNSNSDDEEQLSVEIRD